MEFVKFITVAVLGALTTSKDEASLLNNQVETVTALNTGVKLMPQEKTDENTVYTLSQLISSAIAKSDPKTIPTLPGFPLNVTTAITELKKINIEYVNGQFAMSNNKTLEGLYANTTWTETSQSYTFMWRRDCFFANYTPSNHFLHNLGPPYRSPAGLDYSHFGLIGYNK